MSKLVQNPIDGLPDVGEPVLNAMDGVFAEVCKNKVNTINKQNEVVESKNAFDSALKGDDAQKLLDAYNAYQAKVNDNPRKKEIDNQVKGWLQLEKEHNYKKRYIECAKANAEKFISLYYEIVESKLSDNSQSKLPDNSQSKLPDNSSPEDLKKLILGKDGYEFVDITMNDGQLNYLNVQINNLLSDTRLSGKKLDQWKEFMADVETAGIRSKYVNIVRILDDYFVPKNNNNNAE